MSLLPRIQIAVTCCPVAAGCVSQPIGPAVAVKPGHDKPFTVFLQDDAQCKQYAREQLARGVDTRAASDAHVPRAQLNVQQRYDLAYLECMRAKGNEVTERAGINYAT
ncbi:hypothetical protein GCT13_31735 [Paraburkholderia sp. CNPSo 3157]|uniref:Glycine zipper family protein n=1 Tax=Paraburkholderia franconis TaxID=2654983 RepID=A0A7X1TJC5_9BURK|nr:hypothetical protein [Paraburkholderia franconis]MPW21326.1 hypothetical protein [Paraburkholderia franconis]